MSSIQQSEVSPTPSLAEKKLKRALYFFRTGDLTSWNYAILALSFVGLFLGLFLLSRNIMANRKRKMIAMYQQSGTTADTAEEDNKQAFVILEKDGSSQDDNLLKKELMPGDIAVQWKDGQLTSLFLDAPEADV
ncbi:organic solute transporter subunit beta isoform 1-T2 [Discoglossus pictus]